MSLSVQFLPKNANGTFVALFQSLNPKVLDVIVANFQTKKFVSKKSFTSDNVKQFVDDIPKIFNKKFNAVILNVFSFNPIEYENEMEFFQVVRKKFASINIPSYFISIPEYMSTCFFIATNTFIDVDETVIYLLENAVFECKYTKNGYDKDVVDNIDCNLNADAETLRNKILRSSNPKKIIFATSPIESEMTTFLKNQVLKGYVVETFDLKKLRAFDVSFAIEMSKWLLDKSYTKFYFQPKSSKQFALVFFSFEKETPTPYEILSVQPHDSLPVNKTAIIERNPYDRKVCLVSIDPCTKKKTLLQKFDIKQKCHLNEITLKVDAESFPTVEVQPCLNPKLLSMPICMQKSFELTEERIPFIGIYGNYSVITNCKNDDDKNKYEFLESWNGIFGNILAIAFHKKKPVFGDAIHNEQDVNPASIIYDIIKIMSMPFNDIKAEKHWHFKITKDENNPVLLQFENFDGTLKAASPAFLMALLLRQHLKAIEAETGAKPLELGFCLFDKFNEDEEKRIKEQIIESCTLLKIYCKYCIFI